MVIYILETINDGATNWAISSKFILQNHFFLQMPKNGYFGVCFPVSRRIAKFVLLRLRFMPCLLKRWVILLFIYKFDVYT